MLYIIQELKVKRQINIRISGLTINQIEQLISNTGMTKTEIISLAIDRMYREENKKNARDLFERFVDDSVSYDEIARMEIDKITIQIGEMRQEEPDKINMSNREIAAAILEYAKGNETDLNQI